MFITQRGDRSGKTRSFVCDAQQGSFFTATTDDVTRLEAKLPLFFEEISQKTGPGSFPYVNARFLKVLPGYRRQYVGLIENGNRYIWVSTTCTDRLDWRTGPIYVEDGGACFWTILFNIESGSFEKLQFNGEA